MKSLTTNCAKIWRTMLQYPEFQNLANAYKIYFKDWFMPSSDLSFLRKYKKFRYTKMDGKLEFAWIHPNYVSGGKICNQTVDHYCMLLQLATWAIRNWYSVIEFNIFPRTGGADVVLDCELETIAFEYERNGSNSHNDLWNKKRDILNEGWTPMFVCQSTNYKHVVQAVGEQYVVARGQALMARLDQIVRLHPRRIRRIDYSWESI